jgi:pSer/pThr/pTyr-binding forkhead associated (FHA) protein
MLGLLDTAQPFRSSTFYNATFLYGLDFASVGLTHIPRNGKRYQELVADPQARTYRKVLLNDGVPVGALSLGDRKGTLAFKRVIDHKVNLAPVLSRLFSSDFNLAQWLDKQGVPPALLGVTRAGNAAVRQVAYAGGMVVATVMKAQPLIEAFLIPEVSGGNRADLSGEMPLSQTKVISIGRQAGVDFLIDNGSVSRRHAEISYANGQYILRDVGSANGTFVNGSRLDSGSTHLLKHNDRLRFGNVPYVFITNSVDRKTTRSSSRAVAPGSTAFHRMGTGFYDLASAGNAPPPQSQLILNADGSLLLPGATEAIPASDVASFKEVLVMVGRDKPAVYHLKQGKRIKMGRDKGNDIVLADIAASRLHAEVFHASDGYYIRDLDSINGVVVNSAKIAHPYRLTHGDRIVIGGITLYFISIESEQGAQFIPVGAGDARCSNCGTLNPDNARFCVNCGSPVRREQVAARA